MDFFSKTVDFLTGGIGSKIVDTIAGQFPSQLSEQDKAKLKIAVDKANREYEIQLLDLARQQDLEFSKRISDMEGTAKDLSQFGYLGKAVVFLRGLQRPLWGYGVLYMDFMVFSGRWTLVPLIDAGNNVNIGGNIDSAFWVINFLVLGFLFGERAMKNVMPLIKGISNGK